MSIQEARDITSGRTPAAARRTLRILIPVLAIFAFGWVLGYLTPRTAAPGRLVRSALARIGYSAPESPTPPGHWGRAQPLAMTGHLSAEMAKEVKRLQSLGYTGGTLPATARDAGVTAHDPAAASSAPRFYVSGHEPGASLIDAQGNILHHWRFTYEDCLAQTTRDPGAFLPDPKQVTACWRRARLLPGGQVLAIFEGHGLVKIDRDSRLIWSYPGACHHDLDLAPDGSIYVLTRRAALLPGYNAERPLLLDSITHLDPDGREAGSLDLLSAFENSVYASYLENMKPAGDVFHTNTLERLDGRLEHLSPLFREGNFLISVRELDIVAIVDPEQKTVVWALSGMWSAQHQPTLLDDGHILLFDNRGNGGRSKVVEVDPFTQRIVWSYADGPGHSLYSETCGSCQRLPGGNTMITETENGRALEVAPDGRTVWEFRNPQRTGHDDEFIAAIMEMVVLPADFPLDWLGSG